MNNKPRILFLCTGNSCRSQMAEGLCRHFQGENFRAYSAGIKKHGLNPNAVKAMKEIGIDISNHTSNTTDELEEKEFEFVITVCGHAHESCPYFPAKTKIIHQGFDDPPFLAKTAKTAEEALGHYRRVRDEIKEFIISLPDFLSAEIEQ